MHCVAGRGVHCATGRGVDHRGAAHHKIDDIIEILCNKNILLFLHVPPLFSRLLFHVTYVFIVQ